MVKTINIKQTNNYYNDLRAETRLQQQQQQQQLYPLRGNDMKIMTTTTIATITRDKAFDHVVGTIEAALWPRDAAVINMFDELRRPCGPRR